LQGIVSNTPITHPDYENLVTALSLVSQLYESVQEAIEQAHNRAHLFELKRRMDVEDYQFLEALGEQPQCLREGPAVLLEKKEKKKRYLFLFSDRLLVTKKHHKNLLRYKTTLVFERATLVESAELSNGLLV
jgi:hypothetical protein